MATALQQQLAVINANSTDQLNLKAQKARHSQSLLYEAREASGQSFETLFQICEDGFAELCQLDRRYVSFAKNLFAESSIGIEREQMTASENQELDAVVEQFLALVCGKLLLRPAQKSVEWLVRRWRIHEYNTSTMLFAFMPYHGHHIFATLLSIVPKQIPAAFSFLRPYIASLQSPPRHAILSAATSNTSFMADYSSFVLSASKRRLQSSILVGSWISLFAQSLNAKLDGAQSGRDTVRRQKSEDVLLSILPTLQEMLAISEAQDLFLAACMVMTILATKIDLEDKVVDAFMDSIVTNWTRDTIRDGIECLAVLAEEKSDASLSRKVYSAIMKREEAISAILALENKLRADNLIAGLLEAYLTSSRPETDLRTPELVNQLVQYAAQHDLLSSAFRQKLSAWKQNQAISSSSKLQLLLDQITEEPQDIEMSDDQAIPLLENSTQDGETAATLLQSLPDLPTKPFSFLDAKSGDVLYKTYLACFEKSCQNETSLNVFLEQSQLHKTQAGSRPELLSLLARAWSSATHFTVKRHALQAATQLLAKNEKFGSIDLQPLYPYLLSAFSDASSQVRRAAAQLCLQILACTRDEKPDTLKVWAQSSIYGQASTKLKWLPHSTGISFLKKTIEPRLEEFVLDRNVCQASVVAYLNDGNVKSSVRSSIAEFLIGALALSSVQEVQLTMLSIVGKVGKTANHTRSAIIVPFVKSATSSSPLLPAAIQCLTHRSSEEVQLLKDLAVNDILSTADLAAQRLQQVFPRCKPDVQLDLTAWLFEQALGSGSSKDMAHQTLRSVTLPVESLVQLLSLTTTALPPIESDRPVKRQRIGKTQVEKTLTDPQQLDNNLRRSTLCLELIEDSVSGLNRATEPTLYAQLIKQLFNLLGEVQAWRSTTGSNLTYLQTLTLNNILATLSYVDASDAKTIDRSYLRTDMIVETLRSTSSPQVHNSALLVISKIATFAPDTVLHSIMPLFTFMSSSTLRQADAYSVHVINMTIESIVPPLRESLKSRGKDLVAGASDLLLSFVAAFEHVPSHRRHDTFVQLLKVLGAEDTLYAVMAMLIERYYEDNTISNTCRGIMMAFDVQTQMNAFAQYLDLTADACKKRKTLSETILGFGEKNAAEANLSVATLLDGWANLLSNPSLQAKISNELRKVNAAQSLRNVYSVLLERLVSLPQLNTNVVKFDEPTLKAAHDSALQALLALLPTEEFILSSAELMQAGSEQVRIKVFASLTNRVRTARAGDARLAAIFIETLPNCAVFLATSQPISVRKAALDCVDAICEKFGKTDRNVVGDVAKVLLSSAALLSDVPVLQIASILCFASSVEVLGADFAAHAGQVLQRALDLATVALNSRTNDASIVDATFTLINAVLDHEAWLLGAVILDQAVVLVCKAQASSSIRSWSAMQFSTLASKQIALRELCMSFDRTFDQITELGGKAMAVRAMMLQAMTSHNTKATVTKNATALSALLLRSFDDLQSSSIESTSETESDIEKAYETSLQWALDMTLKMNDITFRPLFVRLVEWAQADISPYGRTSKTVRQIALYDFAQRLFSQLGSIVTSYSSFLLDGANLVLTSDRKDAAWTKLAVTVLDTLLASFKGDQDDFWSAPQHFEAIASALLGLIEKPIEAAGDHVSDTIVELAAAVSGSPEHLKFMNTQIMTTLRSQSATVRLAAIRCERKITERLTFDWLNLLPEMLPFISELLEDDDEAVEREVLGWVAQIEEVTGESLEGMLA